jgi:hypothetical protein
MKITLLAVLMSFGSFASTSTFASNCEQAAEVAATEKFRNLEYGCYGNARLVEKLNNNTMRVTVDAIGGSGSCTQKVYDVKFKDSGRTCSIVSVTRIGMGGI